MSIPQIHWHEGLFLQPHHLQRLQKNTLDQFGDERQLAMYYAYGVVEASLSLDDLKNQRLRFQKLSVVMPGGAVLSFPENTVLPSMDIRDAFAANPKGFTVYLGLPHWFEKDSNTLEEESSVGHRVKKLYRVPRQIREIRDENTGENPQPMQFRHYNAMLLLDSEDDTNLEKIPLMRIVHDVSHEEPFPRVDPAYVGPSLLLSASPSLREMVREITAQIEAVREQLANIVSRGSESHTISRLQLEQSLRLSSLNRYVARMPGLLAVGEGNASVPPFDAYRELQTILADLMALYPERLPFKLIPYMHDNPWYCFHGTISMIRNFLHGSVTQPYWEVKFEPGRNAVTRLAKLEEKHFTEPAAWFIGIKTSMEPAALNELVKDMDRFKLLPISYLDHNLRGLQLAEERFPPLELPAESGRYYFRINTAGRPMVWKDARADLELAIEWGAQREVLELQLSLFMTMQSGK